jgi:hypothetical protein
MLLEKLALARLGPFTRLPEATADLLGKRPAGHRPGHPGQPLGRVGVCLAVNHEIADVGEDLLGEGVRGVLGIGAAQVSEALGGERDAEPGAARAGEQPPYLSRRQCGELVHHH